MADTTKGEPKPGTRKVTVGALGGAIVTILVSIVSTTGFELSPEVISASTTLVTALIVYMTTETFT